MPLWCIYRCTASCEVGAGRHRALDWTIVAPGLLTSDAASGKIDIESGQPDSEPRTSRANVANVIREVLENPSTAGRMIEFSDGGTPIAEALTARR